ncbi:hypothetical protein C8Q80DRAFT_1273143 [Daedaleopsis nitida]|nr:hypothetical protein C8Q80DRAFT_1273143 [Daedaleopsis nitida]
MRRPATPFLALLFISALFLLGTVLSVHCLLGTVFAAKDVPRLKSENKATGTPLPFSFDRCPAGRASCSQTTCYPPDGSQCCLDGKYCSPRVIDTQRRMLATRSLPLLFLVLAALFPLHAVLAADGITPPTRKSWKKGTPALARRQASGSNVQITDDDCPYGWAACAGTTCYPLDGSQCCGTDGQYCDPR